MYFIDTGNSNTAVGTDSLKAIVSGSSNTAIGYRAGYSNLIDSSNVYIGSYAGFNHATGSGNIIIGAAAAEGSTFISNSTIIGAGVAPDGNDFNYVTGSCIAISYNSSVPYIWHNNSILVDKDSTVTVLKIKPSEYSAAFIEYSLISQSSTDVRSGYIKIAIDTYGTFEYSEEVVTSIGTTHEYSFDINYDAVTGLIIVDLVNSSHSNDVKFNVSCRFNPQAKFG